MLAGAISIYLKITFVFCGNIHFDQDAVAMVASLLAEEGIYKIGGDALFETGGLA